MGVRPLTARGEDRVSKDKRYLVTLRGPKGEEKKIVTREPSAARARQVAHKAYAQHGYTIVSVAEYE